MPALGCGLLSLVVTGAAGLSLIPDTCETLPSGNWDDHIASRLPRPPSQGTTRYQQVLVLPAHKLAFCWIPKVASQHFGPLFNRINGVPRETAGEPSAESGEPSTLNHQNVPLSSISRENGWKFALFIRDPLERYLSAFIDKCLSPGGKKPPDQCGMECEGPIRSKPVSTEEMVSLFEERVKFDAKHGLASVNKHWMSQASVVATYCHLPGVNWFDADYVGHITHDTIEVNEQVQEMLRRLTSVRDVPGVVAAHFPQESPSLFRRRCPRVHCTDAGERFDLFYRKNGTVRAVVELMADDYEHRAKLHFTPPPTRQQKGLRVSRVDGAGGRFGAL